MRRSLLLALAFVLVLTLGATSAPAVVAASAPTWTVVAAYVVAPGVSYEQVLVDDGTGPGGQVIMHVMRIDPATPGLHFDLASGRHVATRHRVTDMIDGDAVVAVNGDFFDIRDADAPLGVAVDRQQGLRNGVASGWNDAFWVGRDGVPHVGPLTVTTVVPAAPGHPALAVGAVDSASVPAGGIGAYDRRWGTLRHYRVVDGQRRGVRMVVVRRGRVIAVRIRFPAVMPVRSVVLVGRGAGAARLATLQRGERVAVRSRLSQPARVAVTGSDQLLDDGVVVPNTSPDPLFITGRYPRTAVGIDRDTGQVLMVVVDGRSTAVPTASRRCSTSPPTATRDPSPTRWR